MNGVAIELVTRTTALLRCVGAAEPAGVTTSEAARTTGVSRPTAHRILVSLQSEGLVDRDMAGNWLLGSELYLLGAIASTRYDVTAIAQPIVRELARTTGESAFLSMRRGNETVCLLREEGSFPVRSHVLYEGLRLPLGVASAGLAILAFLPDSEVRGFLGSHDLTGVYGQSHARQAIRRRIASSRRMGYSVNPGLLVAGSWGVGAPVFDRDGAPRWALSLNGIEQRFGKDRLPHLGKALTDAARSLGQTISAGHRHRSGPSA